MPSFPRTLLIIVACFLLMPMAAPFLSGQPLPPYLKMHSPSSWDVLSGDVTVEFTSSDSHPHRVDLYVDGDLIQIDISSPHTIPGLADGNRTITLLAINIHGSYDTESATILMDSTPPVVNITHPVEGQVINSRSFPLNYTVEEENPSHDMYRIDDGDWIAVSGNATLNLSHDGNYSITVRAVDIAGNNGTDSVDFTVDTGMPVIRFTSPEHNAYLNYSDVTVNWTAYNYDHLNYSLDEGPWQPAPAEGVELLGLDNGRHTITLQGSNVNGIDERSLSFYVDDEQPALTILAPLPDMRFGTNSVMALWDVVNDSPYHSDVIITVDGVSKEYLGLEDTSLRISGLPAGHALLEIIVTDLAGNGMEANVSFHVGVQGLPMGAISVSNDDSLSSLVQHMGLPGNGTADDPYLFDNIGIDAQDAYHAVKVEHTSKHIVFSNLSLFNTKTVNGEPAGSGMLLKDSKNIVVRDCVIIGQMYGVRSDSISHNLTITENDLRHSHRGAVTVEQGYDLTITDNDCRDAGRWAIKAGWQLTDSKSINVSGNDCRDHQRFGLALERVNGGMVSDNIVSTTATHDTIGIYLYNSATDTTIRDNDCRYNDKGILLTGGAYRNTIADNDCRNNTHGIEIADWSESNNISENDCRENPYGIYLQNARYNNVEYNNCSQTNNSLGVGIYVLGGSENVIHGNNASGNLLGIHVQRSSTQYITDNDCRRAGENAILVSGSPLSHQIIDNDCRFATLDAIRFESDHSPVMNNTVEGNDCRHNGGSGINISTAAQYNITNNRFIDNDLRSSVYDMIRIEGGDYSYNRFIGNILSDAPMVPINLISSTLNYNNITVQGNHLQNSSTHAFRLHGNLSHIYIRDNIAYNATLDGINVTDSIDGMRHIHIDGNDVSDSGGDGIYLHSNSFIHIGSVSSNTVLETPGLPIQVLSTDLSFFHIDDNLASGHPSRPITITATDLEDVSISGNDLRNSGEGILLRDRLFLNVTVSYNDLRGTIGTLIGLSSLQPARGLHVNGNDLRRDNGRGIWVDVNGLSASTFNDNLLQLLIDDPLTIDSPYIHDVLVDGNQCPSALDNGLSINSAEVRGLSVSGNDLNRSGGDGLRLISDTIEDLRINYNSIDDSNAHGVVVSSTHIDTLEIGHNSLNSSGADSISVTSTTALSNVLIDHNHCNATAYPVLLRAATMVDITVHANTMHQLQTRPLLLDTDHLDRITVSDNVATGSPDHGVEMNGTFVQDIDISGNELGGSALVPVQVTSPNAMTGILVANNNASGLDEHGILIETPMALADIAIEGNTLLGNLGEQIVLRCDSLTNATVAENIAPHSPRMPLLLDCDSVNVLVIRDNVFNDSGGHGIQMDVDSMVDVIVSANLLHNSTGDAINLSVVNDAINVIINDNDCSDAGGHGLLITATELRDILIDSNVMANVGLDPMAITATSAYDVTVLNNTCPDARGTPVSLSVHSIDGLTIQGNVLDGAGSHGVDVEAAFIRHLNVTDNSVLDAMGDGVRVVMTSTGSLQHVLIEGNDVRNAALNAVNLSADTMSYIAVVGNDLRSAGVDAIRSMSQFGTGEISIEDNDCRLATGRGINITDLTRLHDFSISGNDATLVGAQAIVINAPTIEYGVIDHNLCPDALRPLVLEADEILHLRIAYNDLSGSGGEALRIDAAVDTLDVIGNDMTGSQFSAVLINVVGGGHSISILDNNIGANGHGVRIDAVSLDTTLVRNNSVTSTGHPLWISAGSSEDLQVIENNCSAATVLPLRLDVPLLNNTLIEGNDLSGSVIGVEIHAQSMIDTRILRNDLSACGSGINVSSSGIISSIVISENNMTGVPGHAVIVHSDTSMESLDIIANHGDADDILITAPSLLHGNISGNRLQGPITVDVSNGMLLGAIDGNVLSGGISLNASQVVVDSISDNDAYDLQVISTGDVLLGNVNGNALPYGIDVSAATECRITTIEGNSIGSTGIVAVTLILGSFAHNDIDPAEDALLITAENVTVQSISHNNVSDGNHRVFALIATNVSVNAIDLNTLVTGSPLHFLHVIAEDTVIVSVTGNVMQVPSTSEAVLMESAIRLETSIMNNVFKGDIDLDSDAAVVTVNGNNISGTLNVTGVTVIMPAIDGNTMHDVSVNGSDSVHIATFNGNTLGNLTFLSDLTVVVDAMISNNLSGSALMICSQLEIGQADDNTLSHIILQGHDGVIVGSMDRNTLNTAGGVAVNISSGGPVQISTFSGNVLDAYSPSLLLKIDAQQLTIDTMDDNSMLMSSPTAVSLTIVGTVTMQSFSANDLSDGDVVIMCGDLIIDSMVNNVLGDLLVDVQSLDIRLFQDNNLEDFTVLSFTAADIQLLNANTLGDLSINASDANINLTFNTMDDLMVNLSGGLNIDAMNNNTMSSLLIQAAELNINTFVFNTIAGNMALEVSSAIAIGSMDDNHVGRLNASAHSIVIFSMERNYFTGNVSLIGNESVHITSFRYNELNSLLVESDGLIVLTELRGNGHHDVLGSAVLLTADSVQIGIHAENILHSGTPQHFLHITASSLDINAVSSNVVSVPCSSSAVLFNISGDVDIGTVNGNTLNGALEVLATGALLTTAIEGNSMTGMTLSAANIVIGTVDGNTLVDDIMIDSGANVEIGTMDGNSLRHIHVVAASLLNISSISANNHYSVAGEVIRLQAIGLNVTTVADNTVHSGAPDIFLTIHADSARFISVSGNSMPMASSAEALRLVTVSSLVFDDISRNDVNGNVTIQSIDVRLGVVDANRMESLSISADLLVIDNVTGNYCEEGMVISATSLEPMNDFSANTMAFLTIETIGNLTIDVFSSNVCGGQASLNGNATTIRLVSENTASFMDIRSDGIMSLGPITGNDVGMMNITASALDAGDVAANVFGDMNIDVANDSSIGVITGNSMDMLNISSADLRVLSVIDNARLGVVVMHCGHLVIVDGISGNHIPGGILVEAASAAALDIGDNVIDAAVLDAVSINVTAGVVLNHTNNVLSDCGRHGIHLQSGGDVELISAGDLMDAADTAIMVRAGGEARLTVSLLEAQGGNGIYVSSSVIVATINDSTISSGGYAVSLQGPSSLSVENITLTGLNGINCPHNLRISVNDSYLNTTAIGVNVTGGIVDVSGSVFESNGLALLIDIAAVTFDGNDVLNSSTDGLRLISCDQVIVRNNSFINNTGFAINASGCTSALLVWNEFRNNNGATTEYHPDRAQCRDDNNNTWSASRYEGSGGIEGNYWSDWQSPDENNDGIVDVPYVLSGNAIDEYPLVGLMDVYPPYLRILTPEDGSNHSYDVFTLSWEAMDNRSGISLYGVEVLVDDVSFASLPYDQTLLEIDPLDLDEGYRTITVSVRDNDGNYRNESVTILVDRTPPSIVITYPSDGEVLNTPFDLQWAIEDEYDPEPRTDMSWDGTIWITDVSSPYLIDGLDDGEYTIHLRGVDHLGNENITQVIFIVDNTPPVVVITSPDDGDFINRSDVTMTWTVVDENPDFVEVSSNGIDWIVAEDSHTFTLDDGEHTLYARATDMAGNVNSSSVNFTVDTVLPYLEILSPDDGDYLDDGDVLMVFNVTDINLLDVQVSHDGEVWGPPDEEGSHLFTGLDDGEVTLYLRASDMAGNVNITNVTVTVDTVEPSITIDSPPDGYHSNSTSLTVEWTIIESSPYVVEVSYDEVEWTSALEPEYHVFELIGEGEHVLWVRATDVVGNQNKTNVTVVLDITDPQVTITSPDDGIYNSTGTVHLTWNVVEENQWTAALSIDGSSWQDLGQVTEHTLTDLEDGDKEIRVMVTDEAGNHDTDTITVHVDSSEPILIIVSPEEGEYIPSEDVLMEWTVEDDSPIVMEVSDDGDTWIPSDDPGYHTFTGLDEGDHQFWVRATDAAGNVNVSSVNVTVDTVPPELTIDSPPDGYTSYEDEVLVEWTINESSPYVVEVSYDNVTWTSADSLVNHTFSLKEGQNELFVRVTDAAGNINISSVTVNYDDLTRTLLQEDDGMTAEHVAVGVAVIGGTYLLIRPRRLL